ncbi:uncharacterized protein HaLaN_12160, partial [Haematococcus lacustris]
MSGNARGPSTAFCLLYRLFSLGLSVGEVRQLVDHKDSPYIRAVRKRNATVRPTGSRSLTCR